MQKRIVTMLLAAALLVSGVLSILSIHGLQGNARIINYTGVVRGATQRLIKQEMNGQHNDALIARLDGILNELATGQGDNGLLRLENDAFQELIAQMQDQWEEIKDEIRQVRQGTDKTELYRLSEAYFELADRTVSAAEEYSEQQVERAEQGFFILGAAVIILTLFLVWYDRIQKQRQKALTDAEDANRIRSEHLDRMSEDLRAPMDAISELLYVSDVESNDLLFLNEAGRKTFGVTDLRGQKCYKVLQGLDHPCEFCTTSFLVPGENYTWEFTNPITKRHYLLKDRLLQWDGRPARIEIAFDITEAEAEKQALKNTLDTEQMVMECVRIMYRQPDMALSAPMVLEHLGCFLSADRSYLAMLRDGLLYNDFEWCKDGIDSQKENLQGVPLSSVERWVPIFNSQKCVILEKIEDIKESYPQEYELLSSQGIRSLVAAPMEQNGNFRGLLGVDNPPPERIRSIGSLLQTLCYFLMLAYQRTESEQQLSHMSYYDMLTSFYNRNRYIEDSAALSGRSGPMGIVYLDVNGLKDINDEHGHAYGDKVLVECTCQMREVFRDSNYYRIGGDEFVIICPGIDQETFDMRVADLRHHFRLNPLCKAAIGAQWDQEYANLQQVIAKADAKMYEDKKDFYRRNPSSHRYRHHNDQVLHLSDPKVLQEEICQERFVVYLQPQISSSDCCAVGAEALIRYQPYSGSLILPGNFLPLLEESQTISQIDFYVFEYACSQLKEWARQGKQALPVSVNFSRSSLSQHDFVDRLNRLCRQYGVDKRYLEIELTETAREGDGVDLKALIRSLREEGFIVAIDDFGTEYANLALLSTVEFDVLKLDKSLVDDVALSSRARSVVENIVSICKGMQIKVVAEGIETEEQLEALRSCGVELVQGYLFSKPIPTSEYEEKYLKS